MTRKGLLSTRRRKAVVAVAIVVLLLWSAAFVVNEFGVFPAAPWVEPPPGDLLDGPDISMDAEYSNVSGVLTKRINVWQEASLRLVDCDLTIPLEDVTLGRNPVIVVSEGASLALERTTIRVVTDPNLTLAVQTDGSDYSYDPSSAPFMARGVNLRGTTHPLLSLNVSWRERSSELLVMGAVLPGGEFRLLGSLPLVQGPPGGWAHLEFDLGDLAGGMARLALAPVSPITGNFLVSDLRVTDGGHPLPHDAPMSGQPIEDGWDARGFRTVSDPLLPVAMPLTLSYGDLTIIDSTLEFPPGIHRSTGFADDRQYSVVHSMLLDDALDLSPLGGEVRILGGSLTLRGSHLVNVPLSVGESTIEVADTVLEGDVDLLTARGTGGTVERARYVSVPPPPGTPPTRDLPGDYVWAVSAQGAMPDRPLSIRECQFEGSDVALVLNRTDARVSGCEFRNITRLAIWDRDSTGLGSWDSLAAANAFVECRGHRYLRTGACELDYTGPSAPYDEDDYGYHEEGIVDPVGPVVPDLDLIEGDILGATLLLPAVAVEGDGTAHAIDAVRVRVHVQWGGDDHVEVTIAAGASRTTVVFNGTDEWNTDPMTFERYITEGAPVVVSWARDPALDELDFDVAVSTYILTEFYNVSDIHALVLLDGEFQEDVDVMALVLTRGVPTVHVGYSTAFSVGPHVMMVALNGTRPGWDAPREFVRRSVGVMRANASTTSSEVFDFLNETDGTLVLDPGCDILLEHVIPRPDVDPSAYGTPDWEIGAYLAEGSRLVVDGVEGNGTTWLAVYVEGAGAFELRNATCGYASLNTWQSDLSVLDSTCPYMYLYGVDGADVRLERTTVNSSLEGWSINDSNLTLETCRYTNLDNGTMSMYIYAGHSTVRLLNSTFAQDGPRPHPVTIYDAYRVEVSGCTFTDTGLDVGIYFDLEGTAETAHLDVRDSSFSGDAAYLLVPVYNRRANDLVLGGISGNTFEGAGAHFAFDQGLLDGVIGGNTLRSGARAFQMVWNWMDARYVDDPDEYHGLGHTLLMGDHPSSDPPEELAALVTEYYMLFDVTGDPLSDIDRPITIMFTDQGVVVWFLDATLLDLPPTVRIPRLPDTGVLVNAIRAPFVEALDWWTD